MIISALLSFLFFTPSPVLAQVLVAPVAVLNPALKRICGCESSGSPTAEPRQFNEDGSVFKGKVHPADWGYCQINTDVWYEKSVALGYDLATESGNISMANYILKVEGTKPWGASRSCWKQ